MVVKLDIQTIGTKVKAFVGKVTPYSRLLLIVLLIGMYSFLVFRIRTLTSAEPSEEAIAQELKSAQRPKIDKTVVDKITQLQDNSVEVKTLFQTARDNPFHE